MTKELEYSKVTIFGILLKNLMDFWIFKEKKKEKLIQILSRAVSRGKLSSRPWAQNTL